MAEDMDLRRFAEAMRAKSEERRAQAQCLPDSAADRPTERAAGRDECPYCGIPGFKGCAHFLPCEARSIAKAPRAPKTKPRHEEKLLCRRLPRRRQRFCAS